MSGPWIKLEYATIKKPEIMKIARALGIHRKHSLGLCFEFWAWCDANLRNGHIMGAKLEDIDDIVDHEGFGEAYRQAGWITLEDDRIIVVNFQNHLGRSAKNRALSAYRSARYRKNTTNKSKANNDNPSH